MQEQAAEATPVATDTVATADEPEAAIKAVEETKTEEVVVEVAAAGDAPAATAVAEDVKGAAEEAAAAVTAPETAKVEVEAPAVDADAAAAVTAPAAEAAADVATPAVEGAKEAAADVAAAAEPAVDAVAAVDRAVEVPAVAEAEVRTAVMPACLVACVRWLQYSHVCRGYFVVPSSSALVEERRARKKMPLPLSRSLQPTMIVPAGVVERSHHPDHQSGGCGGSVAELTRVVLTPEAQRLIYPHTHPQMSASVRSAVHVLVDVIFGS